MTEIVGPPPWTSRQPTRPVEIAVALLLVLSFPLGLGAPHGVLPVASASPVVLHSAPDLGAAPSDAPARALAESPAVASPTWSPVGNLTTFPSPRAQPAMAYDSELGVVVLFGGCTNAGCFNDTWEYSNGTWTNVTSTAGHAPPARGASNLVDDPLDGYLVLWGGGSGSTLNDTWAFNGTGWHDLTRRGVPAPPPGYLASMAWDAADQYVLLSDNYSQGPTAGTWKFSGGNWTELTNTGPGSPGVTEAGGMDYDATVGAVVYYDDFPNTMNQDGTWEFSGGTWTDEGLVSTPVRAWPGMAYDGIDGYSLLFGGSRFVLPAPYQLNDTWAFEGTSWTNLTASSGAAPSARYGPGMAFDATDGYILLFGGEAYNGAYDTFPDDTWTFGIYSSSHPPAPTVAAGANRTVADAGLSIAFTATPGMYGNLPFTYAWNFGDGGTGTGISVDHVYGSAGVYPVSVTITDAHGLQGNASLTETVHSDPSATFLWSRASVDVGQLVYLNGSVANGTGPFQWNWSFGDGTYAAQSEATHAYAAPNGYEVQLVVTDALGVTATFRAAETVHAHPTVDFTASPTVTDVALAVNFSASAALGTPPYEYTWKFGDGQTVSLSVVAAAHTYSKPGNYPVNLTVVDQDGVTTWQEHT
ncbi:MAG TPA: PKD domain-containing protein, partial [Thermoplasmata archaeon]|nr:PKD domain-containing protein [Thermoplasmata archaeon]